MDPITLFTAAAFGAIIGQGNHQMDGYRDTGCDAEYQRAVVSDRTGEILYYNNPTCPAASGATDGATETAAPVEAGDEENGNGAENGAENGTEADNPKGPRGNASANNDRGGNYDWTGHSDNERGNGRR